MKQQTFLLYCFGIDDVLQGSSKVAGIQVQMSFWAQTFVKHGWKVYSFSKRKSGIVNGIEFIYIAESWLGNHGFSILQEPLDALKYIKQTRPDLVFVRGGRRDLLGIVKACKHLCVKLVFLGASDRDFELGKELFTGAGINVRLYRKALHQISYFITQNQFQADNLLCNYDKHSIIIPNIWHVAESCKDSEMIYDAVWVANLRRLKRAEWFINLARLMPHYKFAIAGGVNEQDYYNAVKTEADTINNLDFLGPLPLTGINELLAKSKLLVCTSEFEGFPNTFLQAWTYEVPIVSTVNPSKCITEFGLGKMIENESQLQSAVAELLNSDELYNQCQQNIKHYFVLHHDADMAYQKVMKLITE